MKVSFTVRKDKNKRLGTLSSVPQLSLYKYPYKNWRSNRMYKTLRYIHNPAYGYRTGLLPVRFFTILFIIFVTAVCFQQKDTPRTPNNSSFNKEKKVYTLPPATYTKNAGNIAFTHDASPDFWSGIPALEFCFRPISF